MSPIPRQKVPALEVKTLPAEPWRLQDQRPERFTMIVFYRGLHCPLCKDSLHQLDNLIGEFFQRGVGVIAMSCDDRMRAEKTVREWGIEQLRIGYGLTVAQAREWGLYISRAIRPDETPEFCEPALALVKPDGVLYAISVQSMPFARPHFEDVLAALDYVIPNDYPARGEA